MQLFALLMYCKGNTIHRERRKILRFLFDKLFIQNAFVFFSPYFLFDILPHIPLYIFTSSHSFFFARLNFHSLGRLYLHRANRKICFTPNRSLEVFESRVLRNLGKLVCEHYNKLAQQLNARWHTVVDEKLRLPFLPVGSAEFKNYWAEMQYCIDFALCNRSLMMQRIQEVITDALPGIVFEPMINIAYNYAAWESHYGQNVIVHRKGATLAREGMVGIIPGSQGTASYIVEGLGNAASFNSCSHGAGRVLSRTAAIASLDMQAEVAQLEAKGIVHAIRSQDDMQEATGVYKDIEEVIANQTDLIKVKTKLLPIAVIKG